MYEDFTGLGTGKVGFEAACGEPGVILEDEPGDGWEGWGRRIVVEDAVIDHRQLLHPQLVQSRKRSKHRDKRAGLHLQAG